MNYHDTVFECLQIYPDLFPTRLEVDNQLFAVIGNGYDWIEGELVEAYNSDTDGVDVTNICDVIKYHLKYEFQNSPSNLLKIIEINKLLGKESLVEFAVTRKLNELYEIIDQVSKIETRYKNYFHTPSKLEEQLGERFKWKIYGISKYSKLTCFPDNIKPDWKEALQEFVIWCLGHQEYLENSNLQEQVDYLQKAKDKLEKL